MLSINQGTRLVAELFFSRSRTAEQRADKQQYTAHKRNVETAEQYRSSWVRMPDLLTCSNESQAGSWLTRLLSSAIYMIKVMSYRSQRSCQTRVLFGSTPKRTGL